VSKNGQREGRESREEKTRGLKRAEKYPHCEGHFRFGRVHMVSELNVPVCSCESEENGVQERDERECGCYFGLGEYVVRELNAPVRACICI
jgi:hypothetical protein